MTDKDKKPVSPKPPSSPKPPPPMSKDDDDEPDGERIIPPSDSKDDDDDKAEHKEQKDKPTGRIKFDLAIALKALSSDKPELIQQLDEDEAKVRTLRANIVNAARKNHILERELQEIDDKIKLLVKNRITVQEVIAQSAGLLKNEDEKSSTATSPIDLGGKRSLYEDFFYRLQSKPRYLAKMARCVQGKEAPLFVQTVVFDLFGDQYDTREERLLLSLFKFILEDELGNATEIGSLLRANTAVTQMLSAYARRGQGLSILKDILAEPLRSLTSQKDLNLEINPMKVYNQMIIDFETETGKTSDLEKSVDDDTAAKNPEVQKLIVKRREMLLKHADVILNRITEAADSVPYGMRWICKTLGEIAKKKFPDIDRYQVGSLMGGYIYLRFFNPVIVTPDASNLISTKPNRIQRRNLILVAKVLQNLSNGLLFGDKELYMKAVNEYIKNKMEPLQKYFNKLIKIDDLNDALQVDKYLEHTSAHMNVLHISLNQIFLLHDLAVRNLDKIAPEPEDPIREIIKELGKAPPQVSKDANRMMTLQLSERRAKRDMSTAADAFLTPRVNPLCLQAKKLLLSVLRKVPDVTTQTNILGFLEEQKKVAKDKGDMELYEMLTNSIAMLKSLNSMNLVKKEETMDETFNMYLWTFVEESFNRRARLQITQKRLKLVDTAMASISDHHKYLQSRLELYKVYLDNVRKQKSIQVPTTGGKVLSKSGVDAKKGKKEQVHKFTHKQLEEMGIVHQTSAVVRGGMLKKCYYTFAEDGPGRFKVELHLKKGVDVKVLKKPIILELEVLLSMQEKGTSFMEVDYVTLNVNLLIHFLNKTFLAKK